VTAVTTYLPDVDGIAIFDLDEAQTRAAMDEDPGVQAGVFTYELHAHLRDPVRRAPARAGRR